MSAISSSAVRPVFNGVTQRSVKSFATVDQMPGDLRACVHEFGFETVNACLKYGVTKPNQIRDLIREIWAGARQPSQKKGKGSRYLDRLDWVINQAGAGISAYALVRALTDSGVAIAPAGLIPEMVEASMHAIDGMGPLNKQKKHEIRLRAALKAGRDYLLKDMERSA